jgi:hypothetical protein
MPAPNCTHIKVDGVRCGSPALRGEGSQEERREVSLLSLPYTWTCGVVFRIEP